MTAVEPREPEEPLRIGVSACLLGAAVRYDGGHKRDRFLIDVLGPYVEWVSVCPEVEAGMGVPRPSVRLERHGGEIRMVDPKSRADHTAVMQRTARARVARLRALDLDGYVLKKDSPSCGLERVRVYGDSPMPSRDGVGLFASELLASLPDLPIEEEGRLSDPRLRDNFIERVFAHRRLRALFAPRWRARDLVEFHAAHKLQLMAHSPEAYRALGRLVASQAEHGRAELARRYRSQFMAALATMATRGRTTNVLQHIAGYLRRHLEPPLREELASVIEDYRIGLVPLVVPVTLLRHHALRFGIEYLQRQVFLSPHPKELMLRNHV